jgi:hypothetical protein
MLPDQKIGFGKAPVEFWLKYQVELKTAETMPSIVGLRAQCLQLSIKYK